MGALQARSLNTVVEQSIFGSSVTEQAPPPDKPKACARVKKEKPPKKTTRSASKAAQRALASSSTQGSEPESTLKPAQTQNDSPSEPQSTQSTTKPSDLEVPASSSHPMPQSDSNLDPTSLPVPESAHAKASDEANRDTSGSPKSSPASERRKSPIEEAKLPASVSKDREGDHEAATEAAPSIRPSSKNHAALNSGETGAEEAIKAVDLPQASNLSNPETTLQRVCSRASAHKSFVTAGSDAGDSRQPRSSIPGEEEDELDDGNDDIARKDDQEAYGTTREATAAKAASTAAKKEVDDSSSDLTDIGSQPDGPEDDVHEEKVAVKEAPTEGTPAVDAPEKDGPTENTATEDASKEHAATEEAPTENAATEDAPVENASTEDALSEDVQRHKRSLFAPSKSSTAEADPIPSNDNPTMPRNTSKSFYQLLLSAASNDAPEPDDQQSEHLKGSSAGSLKRKSDAMDLDEGMPTEPMDAFRPTKKPAGDITLNSSMKQGAVGLGLAAQHPTSAVAALRSRLGVVSAKIGYTAPTADTESSELARSPKSPEPQPSLERPAPTTTPEPSKAESTQVPPSPITLGEPATIKPASKPAPVSAASKPLPASPASVATSQFTAHAAPSAPATPKKNSIDSQASSIRSIFSVNSHAAKQHSGIATPKSKVGASLLPTSSHRHLRNRVVPPANGSTTPENSPKRVPFTRLPLAASPKHRPATPTRQASHDAAQQGSPGWSIGSKLKGLFSFTGGQHHGHAAPSQLQSPSKSKTHTTQPNQIAQAAESATSKTAAGQATSLAQNTRMASAVRADATRKAVEAEEERRKALTAPRPPERPSSVASIRQPSTMTGKMPPQPATNSVRAKPAPPHSSVKGANTRSTPAKPAPAPAAKAAPTSAAKAAPTPSRKVAPPKASAPAPRAPTRNDLVAKPLTSQTKNASAAFRPQPNGRIASSNTGATGPASHPSHPMKKPSVLMKQGAGRPATSGATSIAAPPPVAPSASAAANFSQHNPFQQARTARPNSKPPPVVQAPQQVPGAFYPHDIGSPDSTRDEDIELPDVRSEYSMSDDEETIRRRQMAPDWCKGQNLQETLQAQVDIDTDALFGVPAGNVILEDIFPRSKNVRRRPRSSSANWAGDDGLKQWEIEQYNRRMGIQTGFLGAGTGSGSGSGTASAQGR